MSRLGVPMSPAGVGRGGGASGSSVGSIRSTGWAPWDGSDVVLVAGGAGPGVGTIVSAFVVPGGECLDPVVGPAQRREISWVGLVGRSALAHGEVGGDVVEVAVPGVAAAAGEDAVGVAQHAELAHRIGWVVLVDRGRSCEVQDRSDGDPSAGGGVAGEPVVEELGGDRAE